MPAVRIPIDGLWRCLCPSFEATLARPVLPRNLPSTISSVDKKQSPRFRSRQYSTANPPSRGRGDVPIPSKAFAVKKHPLRVFPQAAQEDNVVAPVIERISVGRPIVAHKVRARYTSPLPPEEQERRNNASTSTLHEWLGAYSTQDGGYDKVTDLVEYLVRARGEKPALAHYDALLRVNSDADKGSAEAVRALLAEMKEEGIGADSRAYHGVLQVSWTGRVKTGRLAEHPI